MTELESLEYRRDIGGNYLLLPDHPRDYTAGMLLHNRIEGLVPVSLDNEAGGRLRYELGPLRSLKHLLDKGTLRCGDIRKIAAGIDRIVRAVQPYLIPKEALVFDPAYVYVDPAAGNPSFLCLPGYRGRPEEQISGLLKVLAAAADSSDYEAVLLAHSLHQAGCREDFVLEDLRRVLRDPLPGAVPEQAAPSAEYDLSSMPGLMKVAENTAPEDWYEPPEEAPEDDFAAGSGMGKIRTNLLTMGKKIFMMNG